MKKLTALILILCVFLTAVPMAAAVSFTDVPNDYRKAYIDDMTQRGLLTGYSDGTFRPDKETTLLESLVILSRFCVADDETKQLVLNEHNAYLTALLSGKGVNWAFMNLAICLETGIVTKDELAVYSAAGSLAKPVQKDLLAVLLVRAMRLEAEALSLADYKLTFADTLFITSARRPYVYVLHSKGIVQGDNYNKFYPTSTVNRAIASIMISKTLAYMEANRIEIRITRFSEYKTYGVLAEVGQGTILVKDNTGTATRVTLPFTAYVKVDGLSTTLAGSHAGKPITLVWSKEDQSLKGIEIDSKTTVVQGVFHSSDIQSLVNKIYVTDTITGTVTGYKLGSSMSVYFKDAAAVLKDLKAGYFITAFLQNDSVTAIYAYAGTYEINATLTAITFGDPIILSLTDQAGKKTEIRLEPARLPTITRGGNASTADKLRSGDVLKFTVTNGFISKIDSQIQQANVSGTVRRIVKDQSGYMLTIANSDGTELTYLLAGDVVITQNTVRISVENLKVGSKVGLVINDECITAIKVEESSTESSVISGSVLFINNTDQTILLQTNDTAGRLTNVTVHISGNTKMLNAVNGSYASWSTLKIYDVLDVYGSSNGVRYEATILIIR